jgi:predicted nucleic acid-binding protein
VHASGFALFGREGLVAPPLMWSEFRSAVHESFWRGEITATEAGQMRGHLRDSPVQVMSHPSLDEEAWSFAERLGWARTYDAEYMALASLLKCRLVTLDLRLRRGADRLGFVIGPGEL